MCISALVAGAVGLLTANEQRKGAKEQANAIRQAGIAQAKQAERDAAAAAQANLQAAQREQLAVATAAQAKAGQEEVGRATLDVSPETTSTSTRRRVRATFTGGQGGVASGGSIRI